MPAVASEITAKNNLPIALVDRNKVRGGWHDYTTLAERNAIPADLRGWRMKCDVAGKTYRLINLNGVITDNSNWMEGLASAETLVAALSFYDPLADFNIESPTVKFDDSEAITRLFDCIYNEFNEAGERLFIQGIPPLEANDILNAAYWKEVSPQEITNQLPEATEQDILGGQVQYAYVSPAGLAIWENHRLNTFKQEGTALDFRGSATNAQYLAASNSKVVEFIKTAALADFTVKINGVLAYTYSINGATLTGLSNLAKGSLIDIDVTYAALQTQAPLTIIFERL